MRSQSVPDRLDVPVELDVVEKGDHHFPSPGYNYAGDAGQGSATFSQAENFAHWRHLLLGSVAAGALWIASPHQVRAGPGGCTTTGTTTTCTGDQSAGITNGGGSPDFTTPPTTTLNVNGLTSNIGPAAGISGIQFHDISGSNITLDVNLGLFGTAVTGDDTRGITLTSIGDVTLDANLGSLGITTNGDRGIGVNAVTGTGDITVNVMGDITASGPNSEGIFTDAMVSGDVSVIFTGDISTAGISSEGIFARTRDGGVIVTSSGDVTTTGGGSTGIFAWSDAGSVTAISSGSISTSGDSAHGIYAMSDTSNAIVISTGNISTTRDSTHGILAVAATSGGITVTSNGNIATGGNGAHGITATADDGDITITSNGGNIATPDMNSSAVRAEVLNSGRSATVTIVSGSTLTGGTGSGAGVSFAPSVAGSTNSLMNRGTIGAMSGTAVRGGDGDEDVQNFGTINGSIDLAGGSNSFRNRVGGIFNSGATVNLGAGNLFLNDGTLSPGGTGNIRTTALTGNFQQSATGIFAVDVNETNSTADLLTVTGTADLSGQVIPTLPGVPTGTGQVLILSAAGGITNNGIMVTDTPTVDYTLLFPNANDLLLGFTVDFTMGQGPGPADPGFRALTPNQMAVGTYFNDVMTAGSGGLAGVLMAVANIPDMSAYLAALDRLHPEAYLSNMLNSASAADRFAGMATGCPGSGDEGSRFLNGAGNQCLWADVSGLVADQKVTRTAVGFEDRTWNVKGGIQTEISDTLIGGAAFSYENSSTDSDNQGKSEGDRLFGALSLKSNAVGPEIIASVVGGAGWFDVARRIDLPDAGVRAEGEQDLSLVGGRLEIAQNFDIGRLYVRPAVAGGVSYVRSGGFSESGSGATDLRVSSSQETFYYLNPSVEFGGTFSQQDGSLVRPFVRLGVAFYKDRDVRVDATMSGAPAELSSFRTISELDDIIGNLALGVSGKTGENTTFSLSYEGQLSEESQSHQGAARIHVGL